MPIVELIVFADVSARLGRGGSARDRRRQRRAYEQHQASLRTLRQRLGVKWAVTV
jgi:hypothetical protein